GSSDIANKVMAYVENSHVTITGTGGVVVAAKEEAKTITVAVGAAGASNFALGGSVAVNVTANQVDAHISSGSVVKSVGTVEVQATDTAGAFSGTGGFAGSTGGAAGGAAIASNTIADSIHASIDASAVSASAGDVRVEATSRPSIDMGSIGAA